MKEVIWLGSSLDDLKIFPEEVRSAMGYALHLAQIGEKHHHAKPLTGKQFSGTAVIEVVENHDGDTYRCAYTVKIGETLYVLHCFQKKSKRGISTPKQNVEMILKRLKEAKQLEIDHGK